MKLIENYIYFHHLDKFCILPIYPDSISDTMSGNFTSTNALGRSAPIFTYNGSGPRNVSFNLPLHRNLMTDISIVPNNFDIPEDTDIIDTLINTMEASVMPKYNHSVKAINPPMISVRIGNEIYIKGIVQSASKEFSGPILNSNKYAVCTLNFTVSEVDPYDAESVKTFGSFRGMSKSVEARIWRR